MIARFHVFLPFDLFITDEEQFGMQGQVSDPALSNAHIVIPTAWGYAERPDPTGTIHEVAFAWLSKVKEPAFSESCLYDTRRTARVNVLAFDFTAEDFDRAKDQLLESGPLIQYAYETVNHFLSRLRVYARLPQVRSLTPTIDPWQVQFLNDSQELLPQEDGKLRMARSGAVNLGVFAFKSDAIKTVSEKWASPEPYIWDQLLLDAYLLWPNIGSSIVTAFAALETFAAWALEIFQSTNHVFSDEGWNWINDRGNWMKDPSVEEQYDVLLSILAAKSLKSETELWTAFKELKSARNSIAHEGIAKLHKVTPVDAAKAKMLIDGAAKIIDWVEALLPEVHRRHNKGFATPVSRRFVTTEQAVHYDFLKESQDAVVPQKLDE